VAVTIDACWKRGSASESSLRGADATVVMS